MLSRSLCYCHGNTSCDHIRLHGSYEALKGGRTSEAMEDFTGGVVESYDLSKEIGFSLFKYMKSSNARLSLQSCSIKVSVGGAMGCRSQWAGLWPADHSGQG